MVQVGRPTQAASNGPAPQDLPATPEEKEAMEQLRIQLADERNQAETDFIGAHDWLNQHRIKLVERMAFYRGWHHGRPRFGAFDQALVPDDRVAFEVYNYIRPTVRSAVQKRIKAWPNPEVAAPTQDPLGQLQARATEKVARSLIRTGIIDFEEFYNAQAAAEIHGAAWIKAFWDPNKRDNRGQQLGGVTTEYCSILDVFPDPTARRLDEIRHIFHRKVMPLATAAGNFPSDFFGEPTSDDMGGSRFLRFGVRPNDGYTYTAIDGGLPFAKEAAELVEVIELWERPSAKFPNGRFMAFSGSTLLAYGLTPEGEPSLPHAWPWAPFRGINRIPGNIYADGAVADAISINKSINTAASKMRETMNFMASPTILAPNESELNKDLFDDVGNNVIGFKTGFAPQFFTHPGINPTVFQFTEANKQTLSDVTSQSDIARGQAPPPGTSARSIGFQAELNDAINGPDQALFQYDCLRLIKICLELIRDGYDDGRVIQTIGPSNSIEAQIFKRDDYDFSADLIINPMSQEPTSRAVRMAESMDLFQAGVFEDTPGAIRLRKKLGLDADESRNTVDIYQLHFQRSQKETALFITQGIVPTRGPVDNDDAHLDELEIFLISDRFLSMDPVLQAGIIGHYQEHQAARQAAFTNFQAQAAGPAPPGPPGAGGEKGVESPLDGGHSAFPEPLASNPSVESQGPPQQ